MLPHFFLKKGIFAYYTQNSSALSTVTQNKSSNTAGKKIIMSLIKNIFP
jgi:hypothetical protein